MASYLFFHPERKCCKHGCINIYYDDFNGNQDPYIWNENFLHSFCKITDYSYNKRTDQDVIFWISIIEDEKVNRYRYICDLVFKVKKCCFWYKSIEEQSNAIANNQFLRITDDIVEGKKNAFRDHYSWVEKGDHVWKANYKRRRITLKADENFSFQPQDACGNLTDITELLKEGVNFDVTRLPDKKGTSYKAFELTDEQSQKLYCEINRKAKIKLKGKKLECIREKLNCKNS